MKKNDYPSDWHDVTAWRGFTKSEAERRYLVRLSVGGKQHFIALADFQEQAARIYDLALWKLAPKMTRKLKPNFPEDFTFITQARVDKFCPHLNRLFDELTWVRFEDQQKDPDELRKALLTGSRAGVKMKANCRGVLHFDQQLIRLKRLRADLDRAATEFEVAHLGIPGFLKLAEAPTIWKGCGESLTIVANNLLLLITSMERQREYLVKLNGVNSGELL